MRETRWIMGMPITVEIVDASATAEAFAATYAFFNEVDQRFSLYKETSEVSRINRGDLCLEESSPDMQIILELAEQTKRESHGFFDVWHQGRFNPSGIVKGWAIDMAAAQLYIDGFRNYFVDAGGDVQVAGRNARGEPWKVGICNPFDISQVVKRVQLDDRGIATSGTYMRGAHIYNPRDASDALDEVVSITVVGVDVLEADRFATAAFAMGRVGISFIEALPDCEGYQIDRAGRATMTSGFAAFCRS